MSKVEETGNQEEAREFPKSVANGSMTVIIQQKYIAVTIPYSLAEMCLWGWRESGHGSRPYSYLS